MPPPVTRLVGVRAAGGVCERARRFQPLVPALQHQQNPGRPHHRGARGVLVDRQPRYGGATRRVPIGPS
eukprot:2366944-Pyramimonas_sp.AAC.1